MNTYAFLLSALGFLGVFGWACWTGGYAAGRLARYEDIARDIIEDTHYAQTTAEDAARRVQ